MSKVPLHDVLPALDVIRFIEQCRLLDTGLSISWHLDKALHPRALDSHNVFIDWF
jgi:hypothetical protein